MTHAIDPLLVLEDVRVDVGGAPACDGLALRTSGRRVLVLGAPASLYDATVALLPVLRGTLSVRGQTPALAKASGRLAGAALDPAVPPRLTVLDYVRWSARLSGLSTREARASAEVAIERMKLGPMAKGDLCRLVPHARRATIVAAALATRAEAVALEDPCGGLPDDVAASYAKILVEALCDRDWIVFAPRLSRGSPLALAADEVVIASATQVETQGAPAEVVTASRRFVGRIFGSVAAIAPALESRGARVEDRGAHLFFDLGPEMTTSELIAVCAHADVAILELVPAIRALS